MIALNHFEGALRRVRWHSGSALPPSGVMLAAAYLDGREDVVTQQAALLHPGSQPDKMQPSFGQRGEYALALDNSGRLAAGAAQWADAAQPRAELQPSIRRVRIF